MSSNAFLLEERIPAGCHHALLLKRGYALRLTDLSGDGNVGLLAFNADERSERYNMGDTLKAQHTHKLALGKVLFSNCPQLNNPCSGFNPTPVEFLLWDA